MAVVAQQWTLNGLATELEIERRTLGKILAGMEPVRMQGTTRYYLMAPAVWAVIKLIASISVPVYFISK